MSGGRFPRHAQNPLSGRQRKTLSITHHALLPPPSHHYLYIISSHQLTTKIFYRNTMSLKRPFVPKSDVKRNDLLLLLPSGQIIHFFRPEFVFSQSHINPLTAKLFNWNFHPLEVVSHWRDPQLQVSENFTKCRLTIFLSSCWFLSLYIFNLFKSWYAIC